MIEDLENLNCQQYNDRIAAFRDAEYPMLRSATYLDHAGTTLYSRSLIDAVSTDMLSALLVNPHSASTSSIATTQSIDDTRVRVLRYFGADPNYFDLIFVANATAAIKLVAEAFRDNPQGFWYGYHKDAHTSVVGVRELSSNGSHCFLSDDEVEEWLEGHSTVAIPSASPVLFAYPGQSNMNGRRLPRDWSIRLHNSKSDAYTLFDAAALVASAPFDLSDHKLAPDFVTLSFYKIFGYPDLGALIVHNRAADVFRHRRYFGGGTVEAVSCFDEQWHASKATSLHARVEDGTLPLRSITALRCALETQKHLYGHPSLVASHTAFLAKTLYDRMASLKHGNGSPVCTLYHPTTSTYTDSTIQGPIIAFNLRDSSGNYHSCYELNKLASVNDIHLRTGTLCNPGGVADALELCAQDLRDSFDAGVRCGGGGDVRDGKPIAMARVSFGACSTLQDVETFLRFLEEFFIQTSPASPRQFPLPRATPRYTVQSVTIYPIKSCAGWSIPSDQRWEVRKQGLAWDREWCLVHQSTKSPLNQKRCPAMAMMRPSLDISNKTLRVSFTGRQPSAQVPPAIAIPLSTPIRVTSQNSGDHLSENYTAEQGMQISQDPLVTEFFSTHLGVPCFLARTANREASRTSNPPRKESMLQSDDMEIGLGNEALHLPGSFPTPPPSPPHRPRTLANESPILTISKASLDRLNRFGAMLHDNQNISSNGNASVVIPPESFRANIVLCTEIEGKSEPFEEESWVRMRFFGKLRSHSDYEGDDKSPDTVPSAELAVLGSCRRCQMICIDQNSGERQPGPFTTLAKFRQYYGGARFGIHCAPMVTSDPEKESPTQIGVGDLVEGVVAASRT